MTKLRGAFAKLARADEHVECLVSLIQDWIDKKPYSTPAEDNTQKTERTWYIEFTEVPDYLYWGTILGDATHNFRSCLDHIAWQAAGGDDSAPSRTEFPIFWDEQLFMREGLNKIKGIEGTSYRTFIEEAQPWKNSNGYKADGLWRLHELNRIDKHQVVHPMVSPPLGVAGNAFATYADRRSHPPPVVVQYEVPFEQHAKVFSALTDAPFLDMQMNANVNVGIGLRLHGEHLGGVATVLRQITQRVREVAEQFRDAGL